MPTVSIVLTLHRNLRGFLQVLEEARRQTFPPCEMIVMHSGHGHLTVPRMPFPIVVVADDDARDWGYRKRKNALGLIRGEWVTWWCDDDRYDPDYIHAMIERAGTTGAGIVFCRWTQPNELVSGDTVTCGNFIVRTDLAKMSGWGTSMGEEDQRFIQRVKEKTTHAWVENVLYHHNGGIQVDYK